VSRQPRRDCSGLSVRQQVNDAVLLKIAQQRPVALTTLPRKVINADDADWLIIYRHRASSHHPQQCIPTDRQHQPAGHGCGGAAA
jgi:hypothetical protein